MAGKLTDETLKWNLEINGNQAQKELNDIDAASRKLRETNKLLTAEMHKLEAAGQRETDQYKSLKQQIRDNNTALDSNRVRQKELEKQIGLTSLTARQLRDKLKELKIQLDNARPGTKEWKQINAEFTATKQRLDQVSTGASKTNQVFGLLKSVLPVAGVGALITGLFSLGKEFFNLTKQMEQVEKKARIVFGESMPKVTAAAAENAKQIGLTRNEYIKAAGNVADLLVPLGFNRDMAADLSIKLTNLSGALDEWSGGTLGAAEVNNILTKAMLGEAEQLKQLGIVIDQSSTEYNNRIKLLQETEGATREQARALDILNQIQSKSIDAQTAFAQEGENLLRTQKSISTWWRQMKENVVEYFKQPVVDQVERQRVAINSLVIELTNANTAESRKKQIWEQLKAIQPEILNGLEQENINYQQLQENLAKYNDQAIKRVVLNKAQQELDKENEKAGEVTKQRLEAEEVLRLRLLKFKEGIAKNDVELAKQIEDILSSNIDIIDKSREIETIVQEINKAAGINKLNFVEAYDAQVAVVKLKEQENELWSEANKRVEEYKNKFIALLGYSPDMGQDGWFNFGKGEGSSDALTSEEIKHLEDQEKKLQDILKAQKEYRDELILGAKSLIEQEDAAYDERLKSAGLFGKKKEDMTAQQLEALYYLEQQHQEKIKEINGLALNDEILEQKKLFDKITTERQIAHNNELAALGNNEAAKKEAEERYQKQEMERQQRFLMALLADFQNALAGEDVFPSIDEALLSEEEKEALKQRIDEVRLQLSQLGIDLAGLQSKSGEEETSTVKKAEDKTDIFGMTADDWTILADNIAEGNIQLQDTIAIVNALGQAWSTYIQLRNNLDDQALKEYEDNIDVRKERLKKQLEYGIITQESYNSQVTALDEDLDAKKTEYAVKEAKRAKNLAYLQAVVNTAAAATSALKTEPPWLGIALAILVGLMGGVQIATIASESLPQFASGYYDVIGRSDGKKYTAPVSDSPGTGLVNQPTILVGEKPEIIIDPATTRRLMLNRPDVIQAINSARLQQYATGSYPSSRETITERALPQEFYDLMAAQAKEISRLNDRLEKGIGARLVADGDYIEIHREVMDDYDTLRDQVDLK